MKIKCERWVKANGQVYQRDYNGRKTCQNGEKLNHPPTHSRNQVLSALHQG